MTTHPYRKLYRSRSDHMIAGVCGGLAKHFSMDPTIVRIIAALLLIFGGLSFLVYVILWIIVPLEPETADRSRIYDAH